MANQPKKVAVIGLDCALPGPLLKHIADGHLPTFKKLIDGGVMAENCLVPYPTITPPNWASIATGAWPGTHGITDFHVPTAPGEPPVQAFSSDRCKAEYLWDAADRAGKKCIVLNYPGSWPSHMKNGIIVGGSGLSVGEMRDGITGMSGRNNLCSDDMITTGHYPVAIRGTFQEAKDWSNLPAGEKDVMELAAALKFRDAAIPVEPVTWYVLARQSGKNGYDCVSLCPTRDFKDAFFTIPVGGWSPCVHTSVRLAGGALKEVFFRCKLIELSDDAENLRLYISAMGVNEGWSDPPEIAAEIKSEKGIIAHRGGIMGYALEWYDLDTFVEINEYYTQWLADAAVTLLSNHDWDLFLMHAHSPDWSYHMILTDMNLDPQKEPARWKAAWDAHLKVYQAQDMMIDQIMQVCDSDTLFVLVSDHGAVADGHLFEPFKILVPAGLAELASKQDDLSMLPVGTRGEGVIAEMKVAAQKPDVARSKCFPSRTMYIYINLKGREPQGIVDPDDYETVQQHIIDALLTYVDPKTGLRPVSLALTKKDARILGLYGDLVGDVVYALYPWYSGQHGNILPAAEWGVGSLKGLLTFTGPGVRKSYRMERNCNLIDVAPTICYLMDLPIPAQAEGAVLYQALKNPNRVTDEINKLKSGLARMETALQRGERQPWDKKDDSP